MLWNIRFARDHYHPRASSLINKNTTQMAPTVGFRDEWGGLIYPGYSKNNIDLIAHNNRGCISRAFD